MILVTLFSYRIAAQKNFSFTDTVANYFESVKKHTKLHKKLWNKDLYGPIMIVNPQTREIIANTHDLTGILQKSAKIYRGVLPAEINVANTSLKWSGKNWAMVMLPLPKDDHDVISLFIHELFHVHQPALGFNFFNTDNDHLDQLNGRIYLRMEMEALKKALQAISENDKIKHLTNAFTFRMQRYTLFPDAEKSENLLELNEGLAEYTGFASSSRNDRESTNHLVKSIENFQSKPSFVRSFAYHTTPVYGYLLSKTRKYWNKGITIDSNLTKYFIRSFQIIVPSNLEIVTDSISKLYNAKDIISYETARHEKTNLFIETCRQKYFAAPHFEIKFEQMQIQFDPGNIVPIDDIGTYYPNLRISDNWGILEVKNGALLSKNWDKVSLTMPTDIDNHTITGDGWRLQLKESYSVVRNNEGDNYFVDKK